MAAEQQRKAIRRFMRERNLKTAPWCKRAGVDESTLRAFLDGDTRSMRHDTLDKLAKVEDVSVAELIGEQPRQPRAGRDIVTVRGVTVTAAMGGGIDVREEDEGQPFYFRREFIERLGPSTRLRVIELTGDSNEPELSEGDVGMIDMNRINPTVDPGFYALWDGNGLVVKRLQILPGKDHAMIRVLSVNPAYPPYDVSTEEGARVIGRLIWRAGMI